MAHLRSKKMFCYGFLAWPMAFIAICLFVFIPKIYHEQYGISFFIIGFVFLITKLINLAMLPFLGLWLDKLNLRKIYRKKIIYVCLPFMALFFHFLIFPPLESYFSFVFFYIVTCMLFSIAAINYYAMSVEITREYTEQNHLSGIREMFTLLGLLTASMFPTLLSEKYNFRELYNDVIFVYITVLFVAGILLHFVKSKSSFIFHPELTIKKTWNIATSATHGKLLLTILSNGISQGLIVTFILFYIKYVIGAGHQAGYLLITYYLSAIAAIPFWIRFSDKNGKKNSWMISMILASSFFASCFFLGNGDVFEFAIICVATGICFGGDIVLSPSIYSDNVPTQEKASTYYSLWLLMNKSSMTICVLISLAMLGFYGLEANDLLLQEAREHGNSALSFMFCLAPAIFKLISLSILMATRIDIRFPHKEVKIEDQPHDHGIILAK